MQTSINGNRIGFSKTFDEVAPETMDRASENGWEIEVNGGKQMVYFSEEVNKK